MTTIDPYRLRYEERREVVAWLGVKDRWVEAQPIEVREDGTVSAVLFCYRDTESGPATCRRSSCEWLDGIPECREEKTIVPTGPLPPFLAGRVPPRFEDETT